MKKRILIIGLAFVSAMSFGQKKELRKAEKAINSKQYSEALSYLDEAESMLGSMDTDMKSQYYASKGEALFSSAGQDFKKLQASVDAFTEAIELNSKIESQYADQLQNLRAALVNGAISDQNAERFSDATAKLYSSFKLSNDPGDLYYAAGNAVNGKNYDKAIEYYQQLLDMGYTGETMEYIATRKDDGTTETFDSENLRNIAIKTGEFIKPETRQATSRKGEILRNLTLIYLEKGDSDKASQLIKTARIESPDDVYLMRAEADMSYKTGDIKKYNTLMNQIVATDPDNPEIYFNLGVGSAEVGEMDKAIEFYIKALELRPDYEVALINLAVAKLSAEDKLVEEMNNLGGSAADNKKYDQLKDERQKIYQETVPYLEKAYKLNPNNPDVIRTLMNIYGQLAMDAKFNEMKTKLETMEE